MFKIGDYVSYRTDGVCKISDLRKENFGAFGKDTLYYVLNPIGDEKSTFFVPADNEKLVSMMRRLLTAEEIIDLIKAIAHRDPEWISDSKQRGAHFKEVLSEGNPEELLFLIHTLNTHMKAQSAEGKKLYVTDTNALKRACRMLHEEFAMMLPLSTPDDVAELVEKICTEENE